MKSATVVTIGAFPFSPDMQPERFCRQSRKLDHAFGIGRDGGQALAQSVAIEIAPEQRTKIKQYVMKERVSPVTISEWVSVGATLPANIELRTVPADWGDERQRLPSLFCRTTSPSVPNTGHTLKLFALVEGFGLLGGFSALSGLGAAIFRVHFSRGFES